MMRKHGLLALSALLLTCMALFTGCFALPASISGGAESAELTLEPVPTPLPAPTLKPTSTPLPTAAPTLAPPPQITLYEGPPETPAPPTPAPTPRITPVKIAFPSFNEETPIVPVGIDKKNNMATVDKADVATWYRYGATPGDEGNAIIAGHVRWSGKRGDFALLHDIQQDDDVVVTLDDGRVLSFFVESNTTFKLNDVPDWVMDVRGEARVTLITCAGEFDRGLGTSNSRTVVICKLRGGASDPAGQ